MVPSTSPALILLGAVIVAMIAAAIYTTGGPLTARIERRDEVRRSDLDQLASYVSCVAELQGARLPDTLSKSPRCGQNVRQVDPYSGEPYRYEKLSRTAFRVCATFETEQATSVRMPDERFDPSTGCLYAEAYPRPR